MRRPPYDVIISLFCICVVKPISSTSTATAPTMSALNDTKTTVNKNPSVEIQMTSALVRKSAALVRKSLELLRHLSGSEVQFHNVFQEHW